MLIEKLREILFKLILLAIIIVLILICLRRHYDFWKRHNVTQLKPHLFFGNLYEIVTLKKSVSDAINDLYNCPEALNQPMVGIYIFHKPALLVRDPELVKRILVKDFAKFSNRYATTDYHDDYIGSRNLFFVKNPQWREFRPKVSPFFTSGKLRKSFQLIEKIGRNLDAYLLSLELNTKSKAPCIELKDVCALYTTDSISTVAFGVQANSLHNPDGEFRKNGREMFRFTVWRALGYISIFFLPRWVSFFKFKVIPKHTALFLRSAINYVMADRKLNGKKRNDLIDIFIELEEEKKSNSKINSKNNINEDMFVAQAALFFTAGFDSSSSTMAFALYELAKRQDLQRRLRDEIREGLEKTDGHVTYELINSLDFLHSIVLEVMRLYPLVPFLDRECTIEKNDTYAMQPFSDFRIGRGMPVYIPIYGIHRDPLYFPDPLSFHPDRFSVENSKNINPFTYLPFGTGPHSCIGARLGLLQVKIGIVYFMRNHYVTTCPETPTAIQLNPKALVLQPHGGIYCNIIRDHLL